MVLLFSEYHSRQKRVFVVSHDAEEGIPADALVSQFREPAGLDYAGGLAGTSQQRLVVLAEALEWILNCQHDAASRETSQEGKRRENRRPVRGKIMRYIRSYAKTAKPFRWKYSDPKKRIRP